MIALLLLSSVVAHAQPLTCQLTSGQDRIEAVFTPGNVVSATLTVNGSAVPAIGPCFPIAHGQPFSGAQVRCSFGTAENRIELYPVFASNGFGKPVSFGLIQWNGDSVSPALISTDCK